MTSETSFLTATPTPKVLYPALNQPSELSPPASAVQNRASTPKNDVSDVTNQASDATIQKSGVVFLVIRRSNQRVVCCCQGR